MSEPTWLSIAGDACSAASLVISAVIWRQTSKIKSYVLLNARLPDAARDLEGNAAELLKAIGDWPHQEKRAIEILSTVDSVLTLLVSKLEGPGKERVKQPLKLIRRRTRILTGWQRSASDKRNEMYWELYAALMGAIEALRQMHKDYKKRV